MFPSERAVFCAALGAQAQDLVTGRVTDCVTWSPGSRAQSQDEAVAVFRRPGENRAR
jgi:hypothetical protein